MQLHGYVVDKSIEQRPNTLDYRFKLRSGDYQVMATYTGIVPDTFKDGAEVVLTGTTRTAGLPGGSQRRDGQVPLEVRGGRARQAARLSR